MDHDDVDHDAVPDIQSGANESPQFSAASVACVFAGGLFTFLTFLVISNFIVAKWGEGYSWVRPAILFNLNEEGGRLLRDLTSKNVPTGDEQTGLKRHLAILVDGAVVSAPTINSTISNQGMISGNFLIEEADEIVNALRARADKNGQGMELRMVANQKDDVEGIADAASVINSDAEAAVRIVEETQAEGIPPPATLGSEPRIYHITSARGAKSQVSYSWVALGPAEIRQFRLDDSVKDDLSRNQIWLQAAETRGKATQLFDPPSNYKMLAGALFYSRECKNRHLTERERTRKGVEYFVLTRDPEIDPATMKPTSRIGGGHVVKAIRHDSVIDDGVRKATLGNKLAILAALTLATLGVCLILWRFGLHWPFFGGFAFVMLVVLFMIFVNGVDQYPWRGE